LSTSAENILPKHFQETRRVRHLPFQDAFDIGRRAAFGRIHHKQTKFLGEREIRFISHHHNVRNLGGYDGLGNPFIAFQPDPSGSDRLQAPAIMQAVGLRIPKNGVYIQKIVSQQLLDGVRLRCPCHVGVIFHPPEIEHRTIGANPAFDSAESIGRKTGVGQLAPDLLYRSGSKDDDINVGWFRLNFQNAFKKQVAKQAAYDKTIPLFRE
jgi:hypothetical protein